ncbi:hypothetical protein MRX96_014493 [Rhipicephalus microplus]
MGTSGGGPVPYRPREPNPRIPRKESKTPASHMHLPPFLAVVSSKPPTKSPSPNTATRVQVPPRAAAFKTKDFASTVPLPFPLRAAFAANECCASPALPKKNETSGTNSGTSQGSSGGGAKSKAAGGGNMTARRSNNGGGVRESDRLGAKPKKPPRMNNMTITKSSERSSGNSSYNSGNKAFSRTPPFRNSPREEDDQPEDFEPPTRNVLLRARPRVFAVFELLTLVVVVVYVYYNPKPWPWSLQLSCASLECFNVQAELHSSMDLSAEPCDDFYQYVCGHWAEGHPRYQDQFRYLESKVYMKVNDKLRERSEGLPLPSKPLSTSDKAVLSYVACTEVLRRSIDVPWLIDSLLFLGKDKPVHFLATSGSKNASSEALATLISLAMDYDLDVLFEVVLTPDLRYVAQR